MTTTPYEPPKAPKTITKIADDDYLDFQKPFTWVLMCFVGIALFFILQIGSAKNQVIQAVFVLILVGWLITWIKYFSTSDKVDRQFLIFNFYIQNIKGKHTIDKFAADDKILQKIVPIVQIHPQGIIEFTNKKYGVLMETHPIRISDEERTAHEKKIEKVVNGIPANTHFKTIACSRLQPRKPIQQYLLEVSSKSNGNKATDQHLAGLYNKVANDGTPVISWKYYAFQSLGVQVSLEAARIQYGAVVPGLLKNMRGAKLNPRIYEEVDEIMGAYRTLFSELVI